MSQQNKTKPNKVSPLEFIELVENRTRREDALVLLEMMQKITGEEPVMWGPSIIGFGSYHYKYESGREGDMCRTGFSPRKQSLSLYIMGDSEHYQELLDRLGKHKKSKGCLYINKLSDVDIEVLEKLIRKGLEVLENEYPIK